MNCAASIALCMTSVQNLPLPLSGSEINEQ
jgi:hypothetical protein